MRRPSCTGADTTCCTAVRHVATRYVLHRRATKNTKLQPSGMAGGKGHRSTENLPQHTNIVVQSPLGCIVNFNDSVEQVATRNTSLQRSHRGSDGRLVSGHGHAFADRRPHSGGSRAHRVDEEPATSRPACHRHRMLCRTRFHLSLHNGMCRRLCEASLAAWWVGARMGQCATSYPANAPQPRVPRCAVSHPAQCPMACATCVC